MSILQGDDQLESVGAAQTSLPETGAQISTESSSQGADQSRVRIITACILVCIAITGVIAKLLYPFDFVSDDAPGWFVHGLLPQLRKLVGAWSLPSMLIYPFAVLGIFILEWLYPAVPTQKTLSTGLINDACWVIIRSVLAVFVVSAYGRLLFSMYREHLGFLTLSVADSWPTTLRIVIAVFLLDLTQWFQHWLHHNVKWLWPFHAVHHAQREINVFSDYRAHSMEYLVRRPVVLLPMLMLGLEGPAVTWWLLLLTWHTRLYHSNIRSNFGWLRYIIVTPQSHRIHHSLHPEHFNQNYGTLFSIWDRIFGTQCKDYDVYPETGIHDEHFPHVSAQSVGNVLLTVARQFVYPFQQIWALCRPRRT